MSKNVLKVIGVIVGAVSLTALSIDATDTWQGNSGTLLGQLVGTEGNVCPAGMTHVQFGTTFSCIDTYEASLGDGCSLGVVASAQDTQVMISESDCAPDSNADNLPWTYISREQAATACAMAGKRLPTAAEWISVARGTPDSSQVCNLSSKTAARGVEFSDCRSAVGVHNMVGNVWEWVAGDVVEGRYADRPLPAEGYVHEVDDIGLPLTTTSSSSEQYGHDYAWLSQRGVFGMLRGGYYGSDEDGGVYAVHGETAVNSAVAGIGFRCVF